MRGQHPEPLEERAVLEGVRRDGVEPPMPEGGWVTATWARQCPADACCFSSTGGSRTHRTRRFELRRFARLRTVPCQRPRWDLNPRLHRDRVASIPGCSARTYLCQIAQVGLEPTASLVLSEGGLPIAYRAMFSLIPKAGVEPADARPSLQPTLSRAAQPIGVPGRFVISDPGWTRTIVARM